MSEKHHWVPQSYLRGFRDPTTPENKAKIFVFGREAKLFGKPRRQHVKEVFCEGDFYVRQSETGKDYSLEKALAEKIDGKYPDIRRKIDSKQPLTAKEHDELCLFMAAQLIRTPKMKESINDFASQLLNWTSQMKTNRDEKNKHAEDIKGWSKNAHADHVADSIPKIAKVFRNMHIGFACAPIAGRRFITSDSPCYVRSHDQSANGFMVNGFLDTKTEIYLPISPMVVAVLSWVNCRGYFTMTNKQVEEQNRMIRGFCNKEFASQSAKANLYWFSRYPFDPIMLFKIFTRRFVETYKHLWNIYVHKI
jgi:hypothetical protein